MRLPDPQRYLDFSTLSWEEQKPTLERAMDDLKATTSCLPDRPDRDAVQEWLLQARREFYA